MGTEPGAEQRPEPLEGVDMHLAEPIPVVVPGVLARSMADRLVIVAPLDQPAVDVILVRVNRSTLGDRPLDQRPDRHLLDVLQHPDDDLATTLQHPEDRRLLLGQGPPTPLPLPTPSAGRPTFFLTASGWPLCPAATSTSSHSTSPSRTTGGRRSTIPWRSRWIIARASSLLMSNSWAICNPERFKPIR